MTKQTLLKRHRRHKRLLLVAGALAFPAMGWALGWGWLPVLILAVWLAHEAWFADHVFYSPKSDYHYDFPVDTPQYDLVIDHGVLRLADPAHTENIDPRATLIVRLALRATWLGHLLDPGVEVGVEGGTAVGDTAAANRQDFERGARGVRYLNLTGHADALAAGRLRLTLRHCRCGNTHHTPARLYAFAHPDYARQRLLILAPHADDAELAAFGLYRRAAQTPGHVIIATLTQGEIEATAYQRGFGLTAPEAAQLKGRLRTWDSLAVPLWGGVAQRNCVQLGYYCLQLTNMSQNPARPFGSRESGEIDTRAARRHNALRLPGDADGLPTWHNLVADLAALIDHQRPAAIVTPHPTLDAHPDHIATTAALHAALAQTRWQPQALCYYANHLHDNDRWPMGPAGGGVALPPCFQPASDAPHALRPLSLCLTAAEQRDKALALAMQHDLQDRLPAKKRLRRAIQRVLAARRWPNTGQDEYFRKAVRRHEVFWVRAVVGNMQRDSFSCELDAVTAEQTSRHG